MSRDDLVRWLFLMLLAGCATGQLALFGFSKSQPSPCIAPNHPVSLLIAANETARWSYYPELLKTIGITFQARDISCIVSAKDLPASVGAVIVSPLAANTMTPALELLLQQFAAAGGAVIAFEPNASFASTLGGLVHLGSAHYSWLSIDGSTWGGAGVTPTALRLHVPSTRYHISGTGVQAVARLNLAPDAPTRYPAVVQRALGSGRVVIFAFDLAQNVASTRQGNEKWIGLATAIDNRRPDQMFTLTESVQQSPPKIAIMDTWNSVGDESILHPLNDVPQADEMIALLADLIQRNAAPRIPVPRIAAFPFGRKLVLINTGDQHENKDNPDVNPDEQWQWTETVINVADTASADYEVYFWPPYNGIYAVPPATASTWRQHGHSFGIHYNFDPLVVANQHGLSYAGVDNAVATAQSLFAARYPSLPPATTARNHNLLWTTTGPKGNDDDPLAQARIFAQRGVELDTTFSAYPRSWGYMTGSGLPMRFLDRTTGDIIDVYESATQFQDGAQMANYPCVSTPNGPAPQLSMGWDGARFALEMRRVFENNRLRYESPVTALFHTNTFIPFVGPWCPFDYSNWDETILRALLKSVVSHGDAVITGAYWNQFFRARSAATISNVNFKGSFLSLTVQHGAVAPLDLRIPLLGREFDSATLDGAAATSAIVRSRGQRELTVSVPSGTHTLAVRFTPPSTVDHLNGQYWASCLAPTSDLGVGDFDGDRHADVYCRNPVNSAPEVALSNQRGHFRPKSTWLVGWCSQTGGRFGVGDFNGDGRDDVYCLTNGATYIALTAGDFAMVPDGMTPWTTAWCSPGFSIGSGDFNGDGVDELFCRTATGDILTAAVADNGRSFKAGPSVAQWCSSGAIGTGDFNADGRSDLYCATQGTVSVRLANADGLFPTATNWTTNWCDQGTPQIGAGNFDGTNGDDMFCFDGTSTRVALSNGSSGLIAQPNAWLNSWCIAAGGAVTAGNFDGDSRDDLLCRNGGTTFVAFSSGSSFTPTPGAGTPWLSGWCGQPNAELGARDFNGDGRDDIYCLVVATGATYVAYSNSTTAFVPDPNGTTPWLTGWCGASPHRYGTGDFNGDGRGDVFCTLTSGTYVALGDFRFHPTPSGTQPVLTGWCGTTTALYGAADFNGDGKDDLYCNLNGHVYVARSTGTGFQMIPDGMTPWIRSFCSNSSFRAADFDGDGDADILCRAGQRVMVARSNGVNGFAPATSWLNSPWCTAPGSEIAPGDWNLDGTADLLCKTGSDLFVALSGGASFSAAPWPVQRSWCSNGAATLGAADADGDGDTDMYCKWFSTETQRTLLQVAKRDPR
jgi:hypothetical protein